MAKKKDRLEGKKALYIVVDDAFADRLEAARNCVRTKPWRGDHTLPQSTKDLVVDALELALAKIEGGTYKPPAQKNRGDRKEIVEIIEPGLVA